MGHSGEAPVGVIEGYFSLRGGDFSDSGAAATKLRSELGRLPGISGATVRRAAIAAFEAEMNVIIHALAGTLTYKVEDGRLIIRVNDMGPGIKDIALAMTEGYTTAPDWARAKGWGNGQGLPNIERNSDGFRLDTVVGEGTALEITIDLYKDGRCGGES